MFDAEESLDSATDLDLLKKSALGDGSAFTVFVARYQAAVFRHALCLSGNTADAEDLLQETFLSAFKAAGQFRGEASGKTWLFHITRHAALRCANRQPIVSESELPLDGLAIRAGWGSDDPESLAMLAEDRQRLEKALAALPREEREILFLRQWQRLSGEETVAVLGIGLAAAKSRLHRARIHLAALLRSSVEGKEA
jgi:RNA polymerase sigma-70 factor (ECF subfamily)